jgi:hypothetical protein
MSARRSWARRLAACTAIGVAATGFSAGTAAAQPPETPIVVPDIYRNAPPPPVDMGDVFNDFVLGAIGGGQLGILPPTLPEQDPFFDDVPLTEADAPGTLLEYRPVVIQAYGVQPANVTGYQMKYTTTDFDGSPTVVTGLLMIPEDGTAPEDRKLIGYAEANDSLASGCMPSYQWAGGDQLDPSLFSAMGPVAQMFGRGWAVVMSDTANNGQSEPMGFSVGQFSGPATLDALRAAISIPEAGLPQDIPIALFGIAGGGVAAGFAAEKHAEYAPELNLVGSVLQAMVVDSKNFEQKADGGIGAGFVFANALGFAAKYPEIDLDKELTPAGKAMAAWFHGACQLQYLAAPFVPLSALFINGRPADNPAFERAYSENTLGTGTPDAPVLVASCKEDFLVPYEDVQTMIDGYTARGARVDVKPAQSCSLEDLLDPYKAGTELLGLQHMGWLEDRFEEEENSGK